MQLEILSQRVAKARKDLHLSQRELAEKLGISRVHLSYVESGRSGTKIDVLEKLSLVSGKPVSWFIGSELTVDEKKREIDPEVLDLLLQVAEKRPEKLSWLKGLLRGLVLTTLIFLSLSGTAQASELAGRIGQNLDSSLHNLSRWISRLLEIIRTIEKIYEKRAGPKLTEFSACLENC